MSEEEMKSSETMTEPKPFLQVYIALFILTIFEYITAHLDNWGIVKAAAIVIVILILFGIAKITLIGAFFMHAKYEYDTNHIILGTVLVPLLGVTLVTVVMTLDFRGTAIPF